MDLFLPKRFPFQKDAQKPLLFGIWSQRGFTQGGTASPQLVWPCLKSLYYAHNNQPIAILLGFIVCFIPLPENCKRQVLQQLHNHVHYQFHNHASFNVQK